MQLLSGSLPASARVIMDLFAELNVKKNFAYFRIINITAEESENLDLRMLRSFRVLRPLKLVSRTPSKSWVGKEKNELR